jgi:hypothetical protein
MRGPSTRSAPNTASSQATSDNRTGLFQSEAWKEYLTSLIKAGITVPEINMMAKRNPARLIGLE